MKIFLSLSFFCCFCLSLAAEIESVSLTWDPVPCKLNCQEILMKNLQRANGVASATIQGDVGRAELTWKPTVPFSFVPLNGALRMVGVREKTVRVKVTGTITGSGKNFSIVSRGDRTNFVLINRVGTHDPSLYVNEYSRTNRDLTPEIANQLLEGKNKNKIAVITGLLFEPYRSPPNPNQLVVEQISFEEAKKK